MLTPSLTGWRAQYDRMQRSYTRVTGPYTSSVAYDDDLHHFMQDCWHLKDWIKNDPAAGIGNAIEELVLAYKSLRIAADLANGSKHLNRRGHREREGAYVTSTNVTVHLGQARPIDVDYVVTLADGTRTSADILVREAAKDWDALLRKLGLLQ
jgi:hypothetical protein